VNSPAADTWHSHSGGTLIHPKTGQLVLTFDGGTMFAGGRPTPSMLKPMPNPTSRAVFQLGSAWRLYHNDARRFGWIRSVGPDKYRTGPLRARLGPDPLGGISRCRAAAGARGIPTPGSTRPARRADLARPKRTACTPRSRTFPFLRTAACSGGTSFADYVNGPTFAPATSARRMCFEGKGGPASRLCCTPIIHTTVAGRATSYCPNCQRR
jgi:formamidopyrimidine-DNA glycosylase